MTKYEFIKAELAEEEYFPSDKGLDDILLNREHGFDECLVELVWDLHYDWIERESTDQHDNVG